MVDGNQKRRQEQKGPPQAESFFGLIEMHMLPPIPSINGARIRELTGDDTIPDETQIILRAFRVVAGDRTFSAGFCLGNEQGFSPIGIAVADRLAMDAPGAPLYVVPVIHEDIAWDVVLRHLRSFTGRLLLFAFPNSDVYDAGTAEISYSKHVRQFDPDGLELQRLTAAQRRKIRAQKAKILNRPPPPTFYPLTGVDQEDTPWIFRITTPAGKELRTAAWNGRRDYAHALPEDIARWVGGDRIAIVQVNSPVGVNRRSSLDLTHHLSTQFDGIIHWARDDETFHSIVKSFVRLDLESIGPPDLPKDWLPESILILAANTDKPTEVPS
jgi:hypothetical protein